MRKSTLAALLRVHFAKQGYPLEEMFKRSDDTVIGTFHNQALQKLTSSRFARVPGQTKKHLLCDECEQRLSVNGESWVAKFAHQLGRGFRL